MKKRKMLATWLGLFSPAKRARRSFLSEGFHRFFLGNGFMGGRALNGGREPLPEHFSSWVRLHPLRRLQANALLPRLHLSDSFGVFSNLHLFFGSGGNLAELRVCDSARALREFSFSGRINDLKPGSDWVPWKLRDSDDLVLSAHFSFDDPIRLVSLDLSS